MKLDTTNRRTGPARGAWLGSALAAVVCVWSVGANSARQDGAAASGAQNPVPPTLEETRLVMGKWIETQQIISKERNEWQQGKEILTSRLELVKKEASGLAEKIQQAQASVAETNAKRDELQAQNEVLKAASAQLAGAVSGMEAEVRRLFKMLPEPIQTKLEPLRQRMPADGEQVRVSPAERFQNVLGILNELNKANNELSVTFEVHDLANGKPSEVQVIYIGLAQAYYVCAGGEAGIGQPTADGWKWEPSATIGRDVTTALEIIQGKHSPIFVPLPVKLQ